MTDLERSMLAAIASGATVAEVATEFGADVDAVRALAGEPEPPGAPAKAARTRRAAKPLSPIERRAIAIAKASAVVGSCRVARAPAWRPAHSKSWLRLRHNCWRRVDAPDLVAPINESACQCAGACQNALVLPAMSRTTFVLSTRVDRATALRVAAYCASRSLSTFNNDSARRRNCTRVLR